jgi:competence protein ComFA
LVWAVCGAGKTEVVFPVIREALAQGRRVLLAVPRREIVRELGERVKTCFPGLPFTLLYGGHKEEAPGTGLVVATTHQLFRFTSYFDLAIIDEADAFPLYGNPMLNAVLERVVLSTGKKIYMTATPDASWRRRAQQGKIALTKIPLRYHGQPLPVPQLIRTALPGEKGEFVPAVVQDFFLSLEAADRKGLLFMPTVVLVEVFTRRLKKELPRHAQRIDGIHARDPLRAEKVKNFSAGKLRLLVTTTLLERGLNFDRLDLMVLYADEERIFSAETLIQIAGRVGRQAADPGGRVYFVAEKISGTMKAARQGILQMNKEGAKAQLDK